MFHPSELQYLTTKDHFLLKKEATKKLMLLLETVRKEIAEHCENIPYQFPQLVKFHAKIARGENYLSFPYLVLDCPQSYKKDSVFTFRIMVWYGNEISCNLHIEGAAWDLLKANVQAIKLHEYPDIYLGVNKTPWEYYLGKDNCVSLTELSEMEIKKYIQSHPFFKLTFPLSFQAFVEKPLLAVDFFKMAVKLIGI